MGGSPHESPGRSRSPLMFAPQRTSDAHPAFRQHWIKDPYVAFDTSFGKGVPMMITWNYGGKSILVEGSWDNWSSSASEMGRLCKHADRIQALWL
ncbi:hypothetical protein HPP92_026728 [Vanilla planifolia]|uniref:AMP-activated protein kinase glycogen-binding domain-containing protein n=1 Tax=Vanilla planifolia TaxID=51239 RepID=A0A835PCG3_VANPL|nr:hypothetical protein HPP92_026728 [Vanilla planifolia]